MKKGSIPEHIDYKAIVTSSDYLEGDLEKVREKEKKRIDEEVEKKRSLTKLELSGLKMVKEQLQLKDRVKIGEASSLAGGQGRIQAEGRKGKGKGKEKGPPKGKGKGKDKGKGKGTEPKGGSKGAGAGAKGKGKARSRSAPRSKGRGKGAW